MLTFVDVGCMLTFLVCWYWLDVDIGWMLILVNVFRYRDL